MSNEETVDLSKKVDEFTEMLEGMTKQELVKYGNITYGLNMTGKYSKPDLVNAIKQTARKFQLNDSVRVGENLKDEELKPGMAEIQLHRTELSKGEKSAIVGLNGRFAALPIGPRFWCPVELLNVLKDAVRVEYEQDKSVDPPELVPKEVHAYPYTVFRMNPHTPESLKKARQMRGFRGRPEGAAQRLREARMTADSN